MGDARFNLLQIFCTEMPHKAAAAHQLIPDLSLGQVLIEGHLQNVDIGNRAGAVSGHRAVTVHAVVHVYCPSVAMCADTQATAHMADNAGGVRNVLAKALCQPAVNSPLVQRVPAAPTAHAFDAGHAGLIGQFIHQTGINNKYGDTIFLSQRIRHHGTQVAGVLNARIMHQLRHHILIYRVGTAADGIDIRPTGTDRPQIRHSGLFFFQYSVQILLPHELLIRNMYVAVDLILGVTDFFLPKHRIVFIQRHLCGCGARIHH